MQKKRLQAYLVGHPLCKSVVNEKGNVTKTAIVDRLTIIRTVESIPESLQEDVNQLKEALELCGKVSEYNKIVKDLYQALDEKCRARYETLTDDEILDLLVNRKWFNSIFSGISDLYAATCVGIFLWTWIEMVMLIALLPEKYYLRSMFLMDLRQMKFMNILVK